MFLPNESFHSKDAGDGKQTGARKSWATTTQAAATTMNKQATSNEKKR
jgi:hypothetical protein